LSAAGSQGGTTSVAVSAVQSFVAKVKGLVSAFTGGGSFATVVSNVNGGLQSILPIIGTVLSFWPGLEVGGIAATKLLSVVGGLVDNDTAVVNAFQAIDAAATGGAAPTPEQWAALDAAVDKAHGDFQTAIAGYVASLGGDAASKTA
jgi:hypothetical protein